MSEIQSWLDEGGASGPAPASGDGAPPPAVPVDNYPLPEHKDDLVGQNKPVDPSADKGGAAGLTFTWDLDKKPGLQGGWVELPPRIGPLRPSGESIKFPQDKPDTPNSGGPTFGGPPPGSHPGKKWDRILQGWRLVPCPGPGYTWDDKLEDWVKDNVPAPGPSTPTPQPDPRGPGDYEVPDGNTSVA